MAACYIYESETQQEICKHGYGQVEKETDFYGGTWARG